MAESNQDNQMNQVDEDDTIQLLDVVRGGQEMIQPPPIDIAEARASGIDEAIVADPIASSSGTSQRKQSKRTADAVSSYSGMSNKPARLSQRKNSGYKKSRRKMALDARRIKAAYAAGDIPRPAPRQINLLPFLPIVRANIRKQVRKKQDKND